MVGTSNLITRSPCRQDTVSHGKMVGTSNDGTAFLLDFMLASVIDSTLGLRCYS